MSRVAIALGLVVTLAAATAAAHELWFRYQVTQAQKLLDSGEVPAAVARLRNAAAARPSAASVHLRLGGALAAEASTNIPGDRRLELSGEAAAAYERAIALEPSNPSVLNDAAVGLRDLGRTDRAIALFKEAAARAPAWGGPEVNLAETYRELARYDEAVSVFRELETRTVDVSPVRIKNALAQVYLDANAPKRAEEVLRSVVPQYPEYAPARMNLGLALFEQHRYAEASRELEEALRLDANVGSVFFLCQLYALQTRPDETLMCLRRAVRTGTPLESIRREPMFAFLGDRLSTVTQQNLR